MTKEELIELKNGTYKLPENFSFEIEEQEDEYGCWVSRYYRDIDDVIEDPDRYRITVVIH
jgi:hypothetical protein